MRRAMQQTTDPAGSAGNDEEDEGESVTRDIVVDAASQASTGARTPGVSIKAGTLEPNVPESCMNEGRTKGSTANPGKKKRKAEARSHASAGTRTPGVSIKAG